MLYDVLKVCVPAVFGEGCRCCFQSLCGRLWNVYMFKGSLGVKSPTITTDEKQRREEQKKGRERVRRKQIRVREIWGKPLNIVFLPMTCGWGRKTGKVARCGAWISFPSRSDLVQHLVLILSSLTFCMLWWMSCAQCDLLSLVWELEWIFCVLYTVCAHGLVKTWWCQWPVCWMSRAQCDLLLLVWELEWIFSMFYTVCAWFC